MGQWVREERKRMINPFTSVQEMMGGDADSSDTCSGRFSFRHVLCLMMLYMAQ